MTLTRPELGGTSQALFSRTKGSAHDRHSFPLQLA